MTVSPPNRSEPPLRRLATVRRGRAEESWHYGAVAIVAPDGRLLGRVGDPRLEVVVRSTAKPFQALPLLLAGGARAFSLDAADLALICSSHSGTGAQRERAKALLACGGFDESDLACGGHRPLDETTAVEEERRGVRWSPLHNNCSGKHAGMLLACRLHGWETERYVAPDHPLQRAIAAGYAALLDLPRALEPCGIDGCSAPTFALPLADLARSYALLGAPHAALANDRDIALQSAFSAMGAFPEMVAGPERFTTALIAATSGRLVGKEGAEGVYAVAARSPSPVGVALKIADGSERSRDAVVLELLSRLGLLATEERAALAAFDHPRVHNHRGVEVGEIVAEFELD